MLQVIEAIEGPLRLNLCLGPDHACTRQEWCPGHDVWTEAQKAMASVLKNSTIAAMAEQASGRKLEKVMAAGPKCD
jgi:DNA-binding IscR family transcriptional regulator